MTRIDNIDIMVEDLQAAIDFFMELDMKLEGRTQVEGPWVDQVVGLPNTRSEIAMMRTAEGNIGIELTKFHHPPAITAMKNPPANTLGVGRIMFAVDDIDSLLNRLYARGATLLGEVAQYEDIYRLCYLRGPEGILIALAQKLKMRLCSRQAAPCPYLQGLPVSIGISFALVAFKPCYV